MARPTIERTLRWLLWGADILAFVWVLHRADLRATFPVFVVTKRTKALIWSAVGYLILWILDRPARVGVTAGGLNAPLGRASLPPCSGGTS